MDPPSHLNCGRFSVAHGGILSRSFCALLGDQFIGHAGLTAQMSKRPLQALNSPLRALQDEPIRFQSRDQLFASLQFPGAPQGCRDSDTPAAVDKKGIGWRLGGCKLCVHANNLAEWYDP
jgi:hypothetical protein